jgi:hypothetical protein
VGVFDGVWEIDGENVTVVVGVRDGVLIIVEVCVGDIVNVGVGVMV